MTQIQALVLVDRILQQHLEAALTGYAERLALQFDSFELASNKYREYQAELILWKQRSLTSIEREISKCYSTVH